MSAKPTSLTSSQPNSTGSNPTGPSSSSSSSTSDSSSSSASHNTAQGGVAGMLSGLLQTNGTKNIEAAYTRAGGASDHLPGQASKLGSQEQKGNTVEQQGVGSQKFKEGISDQRVEEPTVIGKMFNNMINGSD